MLVFNALQCPVHPETFIALSDIRDLIKMGKIFTEVEAPLLKVPVDCIALEGGFTSAA